jgi:hypothetical protein
VARGKKAGKPVALASATHNAATDAVTLSFKGGKFPTQSMQLDIHASLVLDPNGQPLDGGQDFHATISPSGATVARAGPAGIPTRISVRALDALLETSERPWTRDQGPAH